MVYGWSPRHPHWQTLDSETERIECNGENNHVHLLVNFRPNVALAKLIDSRKGVSSRRMRQELPDL
ncbi:hypothetical protein GCM10010452_00100 [Crossiella cryophila]